MKEQKLDHSFTQEHQDVLRSIRISRIFLPIVIGIGAVIYLVWKQFDIDDFSNINWTQHTFLWMGIAVLLFLLWHFIYSARLRVLSGGAFSWWKCIELIVIWEFASAVSPSAVGGSTVAFFILAQEKLPVAKTTMIVLYTIALDGLFFILTIPILYLIFGNRIIEPDVAHLSEVGAWGIYFLIAYLVMSAYSLFFMYGIFINPGQLRRILIFFTGLKWLQRYRQKAEKLGEDMIIASKELRQQGFRLHFWAGFSTFCVWVVRFLILNCSIIAFMDEIPATFSLQFELYARLETMFLIFLFSPTPGGAGVVELVLGGFLKDFATNPTIATVITTFWRLLTYYSYLLLGAIVIPNWIRKLLNERRKQKQHTEQEMQAP